MARGAGNARHTRHADEVAIASLERATALQIPAALVERSGRGFPVPPPAASLLTENASAETTQS